MIAALFAVSLSLSAFTLQDALSSIDTPVDRALIESLSAHPARDLAAIADDSALPDFVRQNAIRAFRHVPASEAEPRLLALSAHKEPVLRQTAVQTLVRHFATSNAALSAVRACAADRDPLVRKIAARAALRIKYR